MLNLRTQIENSESEINVAFTQYEAATKLLLGANSTQSNKSVGQAIRACVQFISTNPKQELTKAAADLDAAVKRALNKIDIARDELNTLKNIAGYLSGTNPLPSADLTTVTAAKAVRAGHLIGAIDAHTVAKDILRSIDGAEAELQRTAQVWIPKIERAKQLVVAKSSLAVYKSWNMADDVRWTELRLTRVKAIANWYATPQSKHQLTKRQARFATKQGV
jgi:hypothetical protein